VSTTAHFPDGSCSTSVAKIGTRPVRNRAD
jgi:hypothetical protein